MTKNELIDAIVECDDPEGTTPWGVKLDKFKALVQTAKGQRDADLPPEAPSVTSGPAVENPADALLTEAAPAAPAA